MGLGVMIGEVAEFVSIMMVKTGESFRWSGFYFQFLLLAALGCGAFYIIGRVKNRLAAMRCYAGHFSQGR
ncbi:hypothetical protein GCM10010918_14740 [Paenibacillus radicis (ex Gao et al. 2016)]|uniref:Uncharacterized protein n=1 Tax=Paenibacillus radicis (ex Gao et al. 2016) TaxID=1737354 RepID=A0A917GYY5_9BACL|nr:hypothetical protein GCM10010918_14740 [Paenibacillus radicis (ex Gao et al. 2016)]